MKSDEAIEILLDLLTELRNFEAGEDGDLEATDAGARATMEAAEKLKSLGYSA